MHLTVAYGGEGRSPSGAGTGAGTGAAAQRKQTESGMGQDYKPSNLHMWCTYTSKVITTPKSPTHWGPSFQILRLWAAFHIQFTVGDTDNVNKSS